MIGRGGVDPVFALGSSTYTGRHLKKKGLDQRVLSMELFSSPPQGGDSDDDVEGFTGSDGTPPSGGSLPAPAEGVSTYGEEDLVPEPHRVRNRNVRQVQYVLEESEGKTSLRFKDFYLSCHITQQ